MGCRRAFTDENPFSQESYNEKINIWQRETYHFYSERWNQVNYEYRRAWNTKSIARIRKKTKAQNTLIKEV